MKRNFFIVSLIVGIFLFSCSDKEQKPPSPLAGTWIFTSQQSVVFPYPSGLATQAPVTSGAWLTATDSIQITFEDNGQFTFYNFLLPIDRGSYSISQDSFLVIKPDTAGIVKFNYSYPTISFVPSPGTNLPKPYANFIFTSDTIWFNKTSSDDLILAGTWLSKSYQPIIPSQDTILLNLVTNNFKRK